MILCEMFMQRGNRDAVSAIKMPHGGIATSANYTNHPLVVIKEDDLWELASNGLPYTQSRNAVMSAATISASGVE